MSNVARVLVVEDDPQQRKLIAQILEAAGYQVLTGDSVEAGIVLLKENDVDAVFSDWKLGALSGLSLLEWVRREQSSLGFAVATAYGTIAHAVEAINLGADDYLAKPFQRQELLLCVDKIVRSARLRKQNQQLSHSLSEQQQLVDLVGSAPCMQRVYERIQRVSNTNATALIRGESGTGKELAARALHKLSSRSNAPFVAVNCGAIPESLAESELFGAVKGAYTGADRDKVGKLAAANGGTLFLDEIGELPITLQTRLLRFLQEGTIIPLGANEELQLDVRVIAATHRNLEEMVAENTFREDLYYRLNIVPIDMPALRERTEDVPRLIQFFIAKASKQHGVEVPDISKSLLKQLIDYPWPGNVRELSNRIERFVVLGDENELLPKGEVGTQNSPAQFTLPEQGMDWESFERDCLQQALTRCNGNRTQAARLMSMSYKTFIYRLEKFGLAS
ncbi:sigma-54-dependent transcriptional regulator [Alteromonas facilis]|uniref:sigma-54-dependent transcriptional regulator n=1 Tax=Alteromonas facilis TaxID=2048004 RepID=UPI000C281A0F|nr:sigma-54 dependent transcriptional regulator [Alteromonas facilis]